MELQVRLKGRAITFTRLPKYLGITLDRSLTYGVHLKATAAKVSARNSLLRKLAGCQWGASFDVLRSSALALCYSCAEYCSPIWMQSAHTKKIDIALHDSMRLISGCIRSTPIDNLPILSGIEPPDIRRGKLSLRLHQRATATDHLLHGKLVSGAFYKRRLKSRNPLSARHHGPAPETDADIWATNEWKRRWSQSSQQLRAYIGEPRPHPAGCDLPRRDWVLLNRLRSGHGRFAAFMHRIGLANHGFCRCGDLQTPTHVLECPVIGVRGDLATVDKDLCDWLRETDLRL